MFRKTFAVALMIAAILWSFNALMPSKVSDIDTPDSEFSTARALVHLKEISKAPHYVGSPNHDKVLNYLISELENLGLETQIQEGYSIDDRGNFNKPKNILARKKGSEPGKAVMLLSHYDSAPHSSFGASDAGSGIVTILEGLRAFIVANSEHKNDIIILFSDAEELGLNGAKLFVNEHPWAGDVGLVLNFEARGSGGPSYMLIETNGGNENLINAFKEANVSFPVANSLAYSIYKLLPNDTDLTRFREDGNIDGFNFAFIDDHYDYHTALDNFQRLDRETLEHQGTYLMACLNHFSNVNLNNLKSEDDQVYFNMPLLKLVSFPFGMIWVFVVIAFIILILLVFYGIRSEKMNGKDIINGFAPFLLSVIGSALAAYILWWVVENVLYTKYSEILHGFPYNGHTYIMTATVLSIGICFYFYGRFHKPGNTVNILVAPIVFWLILNLIFAIKLPGAGFFIIPVYFGILSLFVLIRQRKPSPILMALLCFPVLLMISPFVKMFPVGLGLDILFVSGILVAMVFGMMLPVLGFFRHKRRWAFISFIFAFIFLVNSHFQSGFDEDAPKPNSLVYTIDGDTNSAHWATYDRTLDDWTKAKLGEDPTEIDHDDNTFGSKYNSRFTYKREAKLQTILYPSIEVFKDSLIGDYRHVSIYVEPKRDVQRIELFANNQLVFRDFKINGMEVKPKKGLQYPFQNRSSNRLFTYFVKNNEPLEMKFAMPKGQLAKMILYEASNDLIFGRQFDVSARPKDMIPKPFILNDAVIYKKTILIQ